MNKNIVIPVSRFQEAFEKVRWIEETSKSGEYLIWTDPHNPQIWTRLPRNIQANDYMAYQEKNILILLYALDLPETESTIYDLISQLKAYNYKLINRIVGTKNNKNDAIPYELATIIPEKNINAFRYFYQTKRRSKKSLPIEKFEFNHTEVGSFVIPVSIMVEEEKEVPLIAMQNDTNIALHEYLNAIDSLVKMPRKSALDFADRVIAESIDSKIVKDFFGRDSSIAKYREKYSSKVSGITIGSKGSAFLDYGLELKDRIFKEVDLGGTEVLSEEYVQILEERELAVDETKIEAQDTVIDVIVEGINTSGKVTFTVVSIGNTDVKSPFKAFAVDLPKVKLDQFADLFKNSGSATISGDIYKSKGKIGRIVVDNLGNKNSKQSNPSLFDIL